MVRSLLVYLVLLSSAVGYSQKHVNVTVPSTPEASALVKFVDIPVSLYTGTPNIDIPLYNITNQTLSHNISLKYHASGIKLEEMATWVGAGWNLAAGGSITRAVRGKPDDSDAGGGFLEYSKNKDIADIYALPEVQRNEALYKVTDECGDSESDIYYLSVGDISAKFSFKWKNEGLLINSDRYLKITPIIQTPSNYNYRKIVAWEVIDDHGTKYVFDVKEVTNNFGNNTCPGPKEFTSTWQLSSITDVNGEFQLFFEYTDYWLDYGLTSSQSRKFFYGGYASTDCASGVPTSGVFEESLSRSRILCKKLSRIYTNENTIQLKFFSNTPRTDVGNIEMPPSGSTTDFKMLDSVQVINSLGNVIKTCVLSYDYSIGRLTLRKVDVRSAAGDNAHPPYELSYNTALPTITKYMYAQDHWGYYNGQNNSTLIPTDVLPILTGGYFKVDGANRDTDPVKVQYGVLNMIKYPTGGFTVFEYESNDYSYEAYDSVFYYPSTNKSPSAFVVGSNVSGPTTVETPFTITDDPSKSNEVVPVTLSINGNSTNGVTLLQKPKVKLLNASNQELFTFNFAYDPDNPGPHSESNTYFLTPGTYKLQAYCNANSGDYADITATFKDVGLTSPQYKKYTGGVRIKTIKDYSSSTDANFKLRYYTYDKIQHAQPRSSGVIYKEPYYFYLLTLYCVDQGGNSHHFSQFLYQYANNVSNIGATQGSHVGYQNVVEHFGANSSGGKIEYTYTTQRDYPDIAYYDVPLRPELSYAHRSGLLLNKKTYAADNTLLSQEVSDYYFSDASQMYLRPVNLSAGAVFLADPQFLRGEYYVNFGFAKPKSTKLYTYATHGGQTTTMLTETNFSYDAGFKNQKSIQTTNSKGETKGSILYYPQDFTSSATHTTMTGKGMLGMPVEELLYKKVAGINNIYKGTFSEFSINSSKVRFTTAYKLSTNELIPEAAFSTGTNGNIDLRFEPEENYTYTPGGVVASTEIKNYSTAYIWDDAKLNIAAQVFNATAANVAYTSFEDNATGNWNTYTGTIQTGAGTSAPPTGQRYYMLSTSSAISKTVSTGASYIVSYWRKGSSPFQVIGGSGTVTTGQTINGWTYFEHSIVSNSTQISITGTGEIDEVRLYPKGAQMTSFTYDPLVGVTSQCDFNNRISYYEYDAFNRLARIKDKDRNIIKEFEYKYNQSY